jgi:hypothetical protein
VPLVLLQAPPAHFGENLENADPHFVEAVFDARGYFREMVRRTRPSASISLNCCVRTLALMAGMPRSSAP